VAKEKQKLHLVMYASEKDDSPVRLNFETVLSFNSSDKTLNDNSPTVGEIWSKILSKLTDCRRNLVENTFETHRLSAKSCLHFFENIYCYLFFLKFTMICNATNGNAMHAFVFPYTLAGFEHTIF
jgi:hypothetical protein